MGVHVSQGRRDKANWIMADRRRITRSIQEKPAKYRQVLRQISAERAEWGN